MKCTTIIWRNPTLSREACEVMEREFSIKLSSSLANKWIRCHYDSDSITSQSQIESVKLSITDTELWCNSHVDNIINDAVLISGKFWKSAQVPFFSPLVTFIFLFLQRWWWGGAFPSVTVLMTKLENSS